MANDVLMALLVVGLVALAAGVLLALASHFFGIKEDETVKEIRALLPGANCGACGFAGCDEYAKALAEGRAKTNLCVPGGDGTAAEIAKVLGVEAADVIEMIAVVHCSGNCNVTSKKAAYDGIQSCKAASMLYAGPGACRFGCVGCGDCAKACPYGAICMKDGIAHVDKRLCKGCGMCAKVCPKNLISLVPDTIKVVQGCSNKEKGAVARKNCQAACIGCKKCELNCPEKAIKVENNLAVINYDLCSGCGKCVENCPTHCLQLMK